MLMRCSCLVLALFGCLADAHAQQPMAAPPVPPETENAQRGRAADGVKPSPVHAEPEPRPAAAGVRAGAALDGQAQPPDKTAAVVSGGARAESEPAAMSGSTASQAGAGARVDEQALRTFPPAPAPPNPGPPEKPTTALTSFAPAPVPPPGATEPSASIADSAREPAPMAGSADAPPAAASADDRPFVSGELWSAHALFGVAATFDNTIAGVNPLGFGFGARGDYRLLPQWAVGARVLYFVGGSVELPASDLAMQSWLIAAEGAYVWDLQSLIIQPGIAMGLYVREANYRGIASFTAEAATVTPDTTRPAFYFAPGVNVTFPIGRAVPSLAPLCLGSDVRLDLAFGKRVSSNIQLLGQVGLRF